MKRELTAVTICVTFVLVRRVGVSNAVIVLPIAVALTIPEVRALSVDSPPFGILQGTILCNLVVRFSPQLALPLLDVAGFFLQNVLVALFLLVLLRVVVKPSGLHQPASRLREAGKCKFVVDSAPGRIIHVI
jgi:hypothetical protein